MGNNEITRLDLVKGATVLRQGHFDTLAFTPRNALGEVVDLSGKNINVQIVGKIGIVFETAGTFVSVDNMIQFSIDENIGHGDMWMEITVTDPTDAAYRQKFPTAEYDGKLKFIRSTDDLDYVGFSGKTVRQFETDQAEFKNKMQEDFDVAVAAVTQDAEVVFARKDKATLGRRLDDDKAELTGKLADNVNKNPIYLTDYGVSHLKTAAFNTDAIQQAIIDAESENRPIIVPWVPDGQWIDVNAALAITSGGIEVMGYGLQSRIRQTIFPNPIFDVLAPDVKISGLNLKGAAFDATDSYTTFRGNETLASYYSGIWVSADRVTIENIKTDNLVCGVHIVAWDGIQNVSRPPLENVSVNKLEVSNVTFGLVIVGVKKFTFKDIRGSYSFMGTNMPPHLVYFSDTSGLNTDISGENLNANSGADGHAYTFKGITGGNFNNISAVDCEGLMTVRTCKDITINNVYAVGDTSKLNNPSISFQSVDIEKVTINSVILKLVGDGKALQLDGINNVVKNIYIEANHPTIQDGYGTANVLIYRDFNSVENIEVKNVGALRWANIAIMNGSKNTVSKPKTSGSRWGFVALGGSAHKIHEYDKADLSFAAPSGEAGSIFIETGASCRLLPLNAGISDANTLLAYDRQDTIVGLIRNTSSGHALTRSGGWRIESNGRLNCGSAMGYIHPNLTTANIDLSVGIKYADRESILIRFIDISNMITVRLNHLNNTLQIIKHLPSSGEVKLGELPFVVQIGRRYQLRAKVFGNKIDAFVDGVNLLSTTLNETDMTQFGTITKHGLLSRSGNVNGLYDNIEWRSIE